MSAWGVGDQSSFSVYTIEASSWFPEVVFGMRERKLEEMKGILSR